GVVSLLVAPLPPPPVPAHVRAAGAKGAAREFTGGPGAAPPPLQQRAAVGGDE
ncbi:hypothetical protein ACFDR9_005558, partial [Janthinobacterium sp. CG_23.3]